MPKLSERALVKAAAFEERRSRDAYVLDQLAALEESVKSLLVQRSEPGLLKKVAGELSRVAQSIWKAICEVEAPELTVARVEEVIEGATALDISMRVRLLESLRGFCAEMIEKINGMEKELDVLTKKAEEMPNLIESATIPTVAEGYREMAKDDQRRLEMLTSTIYRILLMIEIVLSGFAFTARRYEEQSQHVLGASGLLAQARRYWKERNVRHEIDRRLQELGALLDDGIAKQLESIIPPEVLEEMRRAYEVAQAQLPITEKLLRASEYGPKELPTSTIGSDRSGHDGVGGVVTALQLKLIERGISVPLSLVPKAPDAVTESPKTSPTIEEIRFLMQRTRARLEALQTIGKNKPAVTPEWRAIVTALPSETLSASGGAKQAALPAPTISEPIKEGEVTTLSPAEDPKPSE